MIDNRTNYLSQLCARRLRVQGGFFLDRYGHHPGRSGYMVSLPGTELAIDPAVVDVESAVAEYIGSQPLDPGQYWGGWADHETGRYHLDRSVRIREYSAALYAAADARQRAIYDVALRQDIRLPGGAYRYGPAYDLHPGLYGPAQKLEIFQLDDITTVARVAEKSGWTMSSPYEWRTVAELERFDDRSLYWFGRLHSGEVEASIMRKLYALQSRLRRMTLR